MLFDITYSEQNGYGAVPSKWFGPFLRSIGIDNKNKVFHSFRHTIVDHLKQQQSNLEVRKHSVGRDTHESTYGRQAFGLSVLQEEVIEKMD